VQWGGRDIKKIGEKEIKGESREDGREGRASLIILSSLLSEKTKKGPFFCEGELLPKREKRKEKRDRDQQGEPEFFEGRADHAR